MLTSDVDAIPITLLGITSGTGIAFARLVLERGHPLAAMARHPEQVRLRHRSLTITAGNVLNPGSLGAAFRNCRVVVSCAGAPPSIPIAPDVSAQPHHRRAAGGWAWCHRPG